MMQSLPIWIPGFCVLLVIAAWGMMQEWHDGDDDDET